MTHQLNRYLIQAYFDWITDNSLTPYIVVDISKDGVDVPEGYSKDGGIVLNIDPEATSGLDITEDAVSFTARFGGIETYIYAPINSIRMIYAKETSQGTHLPEMEEFKNNTEDSTSENELSVKSGMRLVK